MEGFYDITLFLTIIAVAASIVLATSTALTFPEEQRRRDNVMAYARESLDSLVSSTLLDAWYEGSNGTAVHLGNTTTVGTYLLEETYLLAHGWAVVSFRDCNSRVETSARSLITKAYLFSLESSVLGGESKTLLTLGGEHGDAPGYSASSEYAVRGEIIRVRLTLRWQ